MNKASSATYLEDCLLRGLERENLQKVHAELAEEEQYDQEELEETLEEQQPEEDDDIEEDEESGTSLNIAHSNSANGDRYSRNDFIGGNLPTRGANSNEYVLNYLNTYINKNIRNGKTLENINQPNLLTSQSTDNMISGNPTNVTITDSNKQCMKNFFKDRDKGNPLYDAQTAANLHYMLIPNENERKENVNWNERISNFIHTELQNGFVDDRVYASNRSNLMNGANCSDQRMKNPHDWEKATSVLDEDVGNIFVNKFHPGETGISTGGVPHPSSVRNVQSDLVHVGKYDGERGYDGRTNRQHVSTNCTGADGVSNYHVNNPRLGTPHVSNETTNRNGFTNEPNPNNARECENHKLSPRGSENVSPSKRPIECDKSQGMFHNSVGEKYAKWEVPNMKEEDPIILTDSEKMNCANRKGKAGELPEVISHSSHWMRGQEKENYRSFLYVINKKMEMLSKDRNVIAVENMYKPGLQPVNASHKHNNPLCVGNTDKGAEKVNSREREEDPIDNVGSSTVNPNCYTGFVHNEPNESYKKANLKTVQSERQYVAQQCYDERATLGDAPGLYSRRGSLTQGGAHPSGLLDSHGRNISTDYNPMRDLEMLGGQGSSSSDNFPCSGDPVNNLSNYCDDDPPEVGKLNGVNFSNHVDRLSVQLNFIEEGLVGYQKEGGPSSFPFVQKEKSATNPHGDNYGDHLDHGEQSDHADMTESQCENYASEKGVGAVTSAGEEEDSRTNRNSAGGNENCSSSRKSSHPHSYNNSDPFNVDAFAGDPFGNDPFAGDPFFNDHQFGKDGSCLNQIGTYSEHNEYYPNVEDNENDKEGSENTTDNVNNNATLNDDYVFPSSGKNHHDIEGGVASGSNQAHFKNGSYLFTGSSSSNNNCVSEKEMRKGGNTFSSSASGSVPPHHEDFICEHLSSDHVETVNGSESICQLHHGSDISDGGGRQSKASHDSGNDSNNGCSQDGSTTGVEGNRRLFSNVHHGRAPNFTQKKNINDGHANEEDVLHSAATSSHFSFNSCVIHVKGDNTPRNESHPVENRFVSEDQAAVPISAGADSPCMEDEFSRASQKNERAITLTDVGADMASSDRSVECTRGESETDGKNEHAEVLSRVQEEVCPNHVREEVSNKEQHTFGRNSNRMQKHNHVEVNLTHEGYPHMDKNFHKNGIAISTNNMITHGSSMTSSEEWMHLNGQYHQVDHLNVAKANRIGSPQSANTSSGRNAHNSLAGSVSSLNSVNAKKGSYVPANHSRDYCGLGSISSSINRASGFGDGPTSSNHDLLQGLHSDTVMQHPMRDRNTNEGTVGQPYDWNNERTTSYAPASFYRNNNETKNFLTNFFDAVESGTLNQRGYEHEVDDLHFSRNGYQKQSEVKNHKERIPPTIDRPTHSGSNSNHVRNENTIDVFSSANQFAGVKSLGTMDILSGGISNACSGGANNVNHFMNKNDGGDVHQKVAIPMTGPTSKNVNMAENHLPHKNVPLMQSTRNSNLAHSVVNYNPSKLLINKHIHANNKCMNGKVKITNNGNSGPHSSNNNMGNLWGDYRPGGGPANVGSPNLTQVDNENRKYLPALGNNSGGGILPTPHRKENNNPPTDGKAKGKMAIPALITTGGKASLLNNPMEECSNLVMSTHGGITHTAVSGANNCTSTTPNEHNLSVPFNKVGLGGVPFYITESKNIRGSNCPNGGNLNKLERKDSFSSNGDASGSSTMVESRQVNQQFSEQEQNSNGMNGVIIPGTAAYERGNNVVAPIQSVPSGGGGILCTPSTNGGAITSSQVMSNHKMNSFLMNDNLSNIMLSQNFNSFFNSARTNIQGVGGSSTPYGSVGADNPNGNNSSAQNIIPPKKNELMFSGMKSNLGEGKRNNICETVSTYCKENSNDASKIGENLLFQGGASTGGVPNERVKDQTSHQLVHPKMTDPNSNNLAIYIGNHKMRKYVKVNKMEESHVNHSFVSGGRFNEYSKHIVEEHFQGDTNHNSNEQNVGESFSGRNPRIPHYAEGSTNSGFLNGGVSSAILSGGNGMGNQNGPTTTQFRKSFVPNKNAYMKASNGELWETAATRDYNGPLQSGFDGKGDPVPSVATASMGGAQLIRNHPINQNIRCSEQRIEDQMGHYLHRAELAAVNVDPERMCKEEDNSTIKAQERKYPMQAEVLTKRMGSLGQEYTVSSSTNSGSSNNGSSNYSGGGGTYSAGGNYTVGGNKVAPQSSLNNADMKNVMMTMIQNPMNCNAGVVGNHVRKGAPVVGAANPIGPTPCHMAQNPRNINNDNSVPNDLLLKGKNFEELICSKGYVQSRYPQHHAYNNVNTKMASPLQGAPNPQQYGVHGGMHSGLHGNVYNVPLSIPPCAGVPAKSNDDLRMGGEKGNLKAPLSNVNMRNPMNRDIAMCNSVGGICYNRNNNVVTPMIGAGSTNNNIPGRSIESYNNMMSSDQAGNLMQQQHMLDACAKNRNILNNNLKMDVSKNCAKVRSAHQQNGYAHLVVQPNGDMRKGGQQPHPLAVSLGMGGLQTALPTPAVGMAPGAMILHNQNGALNEYAQHYYEQQQQSLQVMHSHHQMYPLQQMYPLHQLYPIQQMYPHHLMFPSCETPHGQQYGKYLSNSSDLAIKKKEYENMFRLSKSQLLNLESEIKYLKSLAAYNIKPKDLYFETYEETAILPYDGGGIMNGDYCYYHSQQYPGGGVYSMDGGVLPVGGANQMCGIVNSVDNSIGNLCNVNGSIRGAATGSPMDQPPLGGKVKRERGKTKLYTNKFSSKFKYTVIEEGSFGVVYKGWYKGMHVAVKVPVDKMAKQDPYGLTKRSINEWKILSKCDHPNIIKLCGGIIHSYFDIWLVTKLVNGLDLHTIKNNMKKDDKVMSIDVSLKMCRQLANVINFLHTPIKNKKNVIIHRDIKPENLIIDNDWNIHLCDFGDSEECEDGIVTNVSGATWIYAPPELLTCHPLKQSSDYNFLDHTKLSYKWDIWSMGCVFQEMMNLPSPFQHYIITFDESDQIYEKLVDVFTRKLPPCIHSKIENSPFADIIRLCLNYDPNLRPTASEIVQLLNQPDEYLLLKRA
ncbi:Protein kinase [Plasmodium coatneyi]|uniref:Protein kinase n=1 Tax=Plasmodium coatneyi TaxID=208452 RepID=A0A1B1DXH5_9APIC|nr:Protein kinase [Plasmodium coatneyi]ANQ07468.1 Protein kinase [Plasmodium coatneyi]